MLYFVWVIFITTTVLNISGYSPAFAQDTQLHVQQAEINNQNQQLEKIINGHTTLVVDFVMEELLLQADKIKFHHALFIWNTKITQTKHAIFSGKNQFTALLLLELSLTYMQTAHLIFQVLTIDSGQHPEALVSSSLPRHDYHHAFVETLFCIMSWLERMWYLELHSISPLHYDDLIKIITGSLPGHLSDPVMPFICGSSEDNRLVSIIRTAHIQDELPSLMLTFLSFVLPYEQQKYIILKKEDAILGNSIIADSLLAHIHEQLNDDTVSDSVKTILLLLQVKILTIKSELSFSNQLDLVAQNQPELLSVFMLHHRLIHSYYFADVYCKNNTMLSIPLNSYIMLIGQFFKTPADQLLPLFINDLQATRAQMCYIKSSLAGGWFKELWYGSNTTLHLLNEVIEVIDTILTHLNQPQSEERNKYCDIVQFIMSGEWLSKDSVKVVAATHDKNPAIQFVQDFLGEKELPNVKSAALQALLYASPVLLMKVFDYFKPYILSAQNVPQQHDKILEFATKNPDLMKQIVEKSPELLDFIALSLKKFEQGSINHNNALA